MGFRSFVWGGFEGATHLRFDRHRVDAVADSGHDRWAALDDAILRGLGIRTVREALRWHRIERGPGLYDWRSARGQIDGALAADTEVIWDICHWGVPGFHDIMDPEWPAWLGRFAAAAARHMAREGVRVAAWVPVNEIAFWSWAGGETGGFGPHLRGQGRALKEQLVRGHLAAVRALRDAGATQPVMVCEPLIHVVPESDAPAAIRDAQGYVDASFEALDWMLQRDSEAIDIVGLNFYPQNQWLFTGEKVKLGDAAYRPLRHLLHDAAARMRRPIALAETGAEEPEGDAWLAYVATEIEAGAGAGVHLEGVCIYPVMDYAGWDNGRHCQCGPIGHVDGHRFVRTGQRDMVRRLAGAGAAHA